MAKKKTAKVAPRKKTAKKSPRAKVAKKPTARKKATAKASGLKLGGISSAAVERATGCTWEKWIKALDHAGCASMTHARIAEIAHTKFGAGDWWSQMVTVGYEQAKGVRKPNQKADGFSASVSRTIAAPASQLTDAFADDVLRAKWLARAPLEIRTVRKGKSVRGRWPAPRAGRAGFNPKGLGAGGSSIIAVWITPKGSSKAVVQIQHDRLGAEADVARAKKFWGGALDRLVPLLAR